MRARLLDVLACPGCRTALSCESRVAAPDGETIEGTLRCAGCGRSYPITNGIPRFVDDDGYARSFGIQWNAFKTEQLDSRNGLRLSEERFYRETGWPRESLAGAWILDAGSGAGRFLEVASRAAGDVVGLDMSSAVDASRASLGHRPNVHFVQASLYALPFRPGCFDGVYCLGVVQHTPDPRQALATLPGVVREGGRLAFTIYERKPWTRFYAKYLVRPLTRRLPPTVLLALIRTAMPLLFPVTEVAFRVPYLGRLFQFAIPVANYVGGSRGGTGRGLTVRQRYAWAIMDTFDMLAPRYDQPQTRAAVSAALAGSGVVDLVRTDEQGLCVAGRKRGPVHG